MLTRGSKGPAVTALQEELLALGYALPRWGADGDLGSETLGATAAFLSDHGGGYVDDEPDVVCDEEMALVHQIYNATAWPIPGRTFYDRTRDSDSRQIRGRRPWTQITGVLLHQVAVDLGAEKPSRWDTLRAHVGTSREGCVYHVHLFEHVIWHGNGFNASTVGVECEGLYAGLAGHPDGSTKPEAPTSELITATIDAIRWIVATVARHGGKVRFLYAHRQSAESRRADPGQELWKAVALPLMAELGLSDGGPGYKIGSGRVIPEAWNPAYVGNPY